LDKERKIQIIKAAVKRFTKHGLNKTTLDEVARDLRIGKATIYHYFKSKEELYYKTLSYEISLYTEELKILLSNETKTPREIISDYLEFKESTGSRFRLIFELLVHIITGTHIEPEILCLQELIKEEENALKDLLKRISKKNEAGNLPGFLANQGWGLLFGSIIKNAANTVQENALNNEGEHKVKKEILINELESFLEVKNGEKK
jgi:AcrR family transcriptional regulator